MIFDRIRENLKLKRGKALENRSWTRRSTRPCRGPCITSGHDVDRGDRLFLFGGEVINTFAFVLLVGIIVGTYSSIFIASPVALGISRALAKRKARRVKGR